MVGKIGEGYRLCEKKRAKNVRYSILHICMSHNQLHGLKSLLTNNFVKHNKLLSSKYWVSNDVLKYNWVYRLIHIFFFLFVSILNFLSFFFP